MSERHISSGTSPATPVASTIYINPRFRNAHINRNFLLRKHIGLDLPPVPTPSPFNIHINPAFLPAPPPLANVPQSTQLLVQKPKASIISQTNRKLVRQPVVQSLVRPISPAQRVSETSMAPLLKIGQRKLVRVGHSSRPPLGNSNYIEKALSTIKVLNPNAYKIDRRKVAPTLPVKRIGNHLDESLASTRVLVTDRRLLRM